MPIRIVDSRVDWGWAARTVEERAVIRVHQPRVDEPDHTHESFAAELKAASARLPGVAIAALVENDAGGLHLLLVKDGGVTDVLVKDSERRHSITLGQDDKVRALQAADKSALFPVSVSAAERLAAGDTKLPQALFFPEPLFQWVAAQAMRQDRSLSWIVQRAWRLAHARIVALADREAARPLQRSYPLEAGRRQETLFFPTEMLVEAEAQAERFDSSLSWVFHLALAIATAEIEALPPGADLS